MKNSSSNKKIKAYFLIALFIILLLIKGISWYKTENNHVQSERFRDVSNLILTKHVKCRMACRDISLDEIKEILQKGNLNFAKSGIGTKGDSTFALEGYSHENQHLRVVVAPENDGLVIITCIDLNKDWPCDCN